MGSPLTEQSRGGECLTSESRDGVPPQRIQLGFPLRTRGGVSPQKAEVGSSLREQRWGLSLHRLEVGSSLTEQMWDLPSQNRVRVFPHRAEGGCLPSQSRGSLPSQSKGGSSITEQTWSLLL